MGCCASDPNEVKTANRDIVDQMKMDERSQKQVKKLLLLGTGSSGKSTLFKSLQILDAKQEQNNVADGVLTGIRQNTIHVIRQNCVAGILTLLKKSQELYDHDPDQNGACLVNMDDEIVSAIQLVVNYGPETFSDMVDWSEVAELGRAVYMLWSLDAVRATFNRRGLSFSFPDNMDHFFGKVREVMKEDYVPDIEDALKCRVRTTGFVHYNYTVKDNAFTIYDVGGQRNERKKWIHQFADVAAVIFVCALNHYHAVLFEDEKKNAMHEAIELFTEICNSKWFRKSELILFLNKDDLFREKLQLQIPLSTCFSSAVQWEGKQWEGQQYTPIQNDPAADKQHFDECYEEAIKFIQDAFISVNQFPNRVIFCHVTCATDQDTVQKVFWDVQNIVIRSNLRRGGLMV